MSVERFTKLNTYAVELRTTPESIAMPSRWASPSAMSAQPVTFGSVWQLG